MWSQQPCVPGAVVAAFSSFSSPGPDPSSLSLSFAKGRAKKILEQVGLSHRAHHYPNQLSGGEQQRVAIARAFIGQPKILFADEPTGNLDAANSEKIEQLLFQMNRELGTTLVLVTHDNELALRCSRQLTMQAGELTETTVSSGPVAEEA